MTTLILAIAAALVGIVGLLAYALCRAAANGDRITERIDRGGHVNIVEPEGEL